MLTKRLGINGVNFYTPYVFKSIGFDGTRVGLLASGMYESGVLKSQISFLHNASLVVGGYLVPHNTTCS